MNLIEIRKLIKMIEGSDISEIEIAEGETMVRISRQNGVTHHAVSPQVMAAPQPSASVVEAQVAPAPAPDESHLVKSPMVGTFYSAASPDSAAFVKVGQHVKKGETLCIIEAMKLMNEIEAEYNGVVEEILVANASPLEYGQPMFVVKPL